VARSRAGLDMFARSSYVVQHQGTAANNIRRGVGFQVSIKAQSLTAALLCACLSVHAEVSVPKMSAPFDAAAAFGVRQGVAEMSLSPDGNNVAFISPSDGQGSRVVTMSLAKGATTKVVLSSDGKPFRLKGCDWISNTRLACTVYAVIANKAIEPLAVTRIIAVDTDGKNLKQLSSQENLYSRGLQLYGGVILDYLPN